MVLDKKEHKELLLNLINSITLSGTKEQVKTTAAVWDDVEDSIKNATVEEV